MIMLPLGLQSKIFRIPWVTLAILIITVIISIQFFPHLDDLEKKLIRSKANLNLIQTRLKIVSELCQNPIGFSTNSCAIIRENSNIEFMYLSDSWNKINKIQNKAKLTQEEMSIFNEYLKNDKKIEKNKSFISKHNLLLWKSSKKAYQVERQDLHREFGVLSSKNKNIEAIIRAQLTHGSWMHLIGNLIFFTFLSIFVELKMGSMLFFILYGVSGSIGLLAHIILMDSGGFLLGASANIAGVAGAFTLFFWRRKMNILLNFFFIFNKKITLPVYFFFPVMVLAGDITGLLNPNTNVAHLAHLVGFFIGGLSAYLLIQYQDLPKYFLYHEEYNLFTKIIKCPDQKLKNQSYIKILNLNNENYSIHQRIIDGLSLKPWSELQNLHTIYVAEFLSTYVEAYKDNFQKMSAIINYIHPTWPLKKIFKTLSTQDLSKLIHHFESTAEIHHELILILSIFEIYPKQSQNQVWLQKQTRCLQVLSNKEKTHDKISS